jgi:hypothetical protein
MGFLPTLATRLKVRMQRGRRDQEASPPQIRVSAGSGVVGRESHRGDQQACGPILVRFIALCVPFETLSCLSIASIGLGDIESGIRVRRGQLQTAVLKLAS